MKRLGFYLAALVCGSAAAACAIAVASASANNDPHRFFLDSSPMDFPASFCGFPVHVEAVVNKEYAKVSQGADGSTILKITGSLFDRATNEDTGKSITFNASGPVTLTFSPDGTTLTIQGRGLTGAFAPNLTEFGFPSNIVVFSGPALATVDLATGAVISLAGQPHVVLDVCAALS